MIRPGWLVDFNNFVALPGATAAPAGNPPEPPKKIGELKVRALSFTYPSRSEPSIVGVDLDISPGEVVALVGENGSGKTTLAKLLAGLYTPGHGSITWDGRDIAGFGQAEVQDRVAVLFQDFARYFLTARENITMGRWQRASDREAMVHAAQRSGAADILGRLPNGYDTYLGPQFFGGSDLSGGQWQRVALARALFREAELVILDEPTASLGPRAEAALFGTVREAFAGKSVLFISHRFATVHLADRIYVMSQGHVVEQGTHKDLIGRRGLYAELYALQTATFGVGQAQH